MHFADADAAETSAPAAAGRPQTVEEVSEDDLSVDGNKSDASQPEVVDDELNPSALKRMANEKPPAARVEEWIRVRAAAGSGFLGQRTPPVV